MAKTNIVEALRKLREEVDEISGGWNGEDDTFQVGGILYTEEAAPAAIEATETIDKLLSLLGELGYDIGDSL